MDNGRKPGNSLPDRREKHGARGFERRYLAGELDGREKETQLLKRELQDLADDRGGPEHLTNAERTLLERAAFKSVLCQVVEAYTLKQASPIGQDGLLPVLAKQYLTWSNSLRRDLEALGLRPERPDKRPSLQEFLKARSAQNGHQGAAPAKQALEDALGPPGSEPDAHDGSETAPEIPTREGEPVS